MNSVAKCRARCAARGGRLFAHHVLELVRAQLPLVVAVPPVLRMRPAVTAAVTLLAEPSAGGDARSLAPLCAAAQLRSAASQENAWGSLGRRDAALVGGSAKRRVGPRRGGWGGGGCLSDAREVRVGHADARLELLPRGGGAGGRSDPGRLPPKDGPKARARRKRVASLPARLRPAGTGRRRGPSVLTG